MLWKCKGFVRERRQDGASGSGDVKGMKGCLVYIENGCFALIGCLKITFGKFFRGGGLNHC